MGKNMDFIMETWHFQGLRGAGMYSLLEKEERFGV